jgi:anti-anti-sigma factor
MSPNRKLFELTRAGDGSDGSIVITVSGELDLSVVDDFRAALDAEEVEGSSGVFLDVDAVAFMDSSALHAVLRFSEELRGEGTPLRLIARDSTPVAQLLELAGLRERIPRFQTIDEARQAFA